MMQKKLLILLCCFLSIKAVAQEQARVIRDFSLPVKTTKIALVDYQIRKVETAFDLALNLSYLYHVSEGLSGTHLILPVALVDNTPATEEQLKAIAVATIGYYKFETGLKVQAIYGLRASYGLLTIEKRSRLNPPKIIEPPEN
ncbi:hypothetical protein [uncultured Draconibacterium sp.]|uniref:hypothetical protein n=1 Tax=uncultured Draconibacterium sp. TaxID=1573823 RepID=UPI0025FBEDCD|nr:hypothetical protein [uncultured Draconibacterium sp.]